MPITRAFHAPCVVVAVDAAAQASQLPGGAFLVVPGGAGPAIPPSLILGPDGRLIQSAAPSASDRRLFLSPAGGWIASTTRPAGARPAALVNGARVAS